MVKSLLFLSQHIPASGFRVFGNLFHTHLAGTYGLQCALFMFDNLINNTLSMNDAEWRHVINVHM